MEKVWEDYLARRPGTIGGNMGLQDDEHYRRMAAPQWSAAADDKTPVPGPREASLPRAPRAPRAPYRFKGSDLAVAVVVFFATWLMLWRVSDMGGGVAAAFGGLAACVAGRWWRQLLVLIVVALGIVVFLHRH